MMYYYHFIAALLVTILVAACATFVNAKVVPDVLTVVEDVLVSCTNSGRCLTRVEKIYDANNNVTCYLATSNMRYEGMSISCIK